MQVRNRWITAHNTSNILAHFCFVASFSFFSEQWFYCTYCYVQIKLWLLKNLLRQWIVMAKDQNSNGSKWQRIYRNLHQRFSAKFDAKITAGMFIETEIWKLINEEWFGETLSSLEKEPWYQFCLVVKIFWATNRLQKSSLFKIFYAATKVVVQEYHWKFIFSISISDFFPCNIGNHFIKKLNSRKIAIRGEWLWLWWQITVCTAGFFSEKWC